MIFIHYLLNLLRPLVPHLTPWKVGSVYLAFGVAFTWVFFRVFGDWGYWIWVYGGSSSGSW